MFVAQSAHLHFIYSRTGLRPADIITSSTDSNLDRLRFGVYIDDVFIMGPDRSEVQAAKLEYSAACPAAGLLTKSSKSVDATDEPVAIIGIEFDGKRKVLYVSPSRIQSLVSVTRMVISRGFSGQFEMQVLLGHWTWFMLVRRPAFSAFCNVYSFVDKARGSKFKIWASVERELET